MIERKTASSRFSRSLRRIAQWCRRNRHLPIAEQHKVLSQMLVGHDAYYGIVCNYHALAYMRYWVERIWRKWLCRRSNAARRPWTWFTQLLQHYPIPPARAVHSIYCRAANP